MQAVLYSPVPLNGLCHDAGRIERLAEHVVRPFIKRPAVPGAPSSDLDQPLNAVPPLGQWRLVEVQFDPSVDLMAVLFLIVLASGNRLAESRVKGSCFPQFAAVPLYLGQEVAAKEYNKVKSFFWYEWRPL